MTQPTPPPPRTLFRILLVEDNPGDAELVREALSSASARIEITHVDSLAKTVNPLASGAIDVVLLDLSLPDATGLEGIAHLHGAAPEIPIVVLTGTHDDALGARAVQAGAQDYLVKGQTDEWLLVRAMRYAIERQQLDVQRTLLLAREHAARVAAEAHQERDAFLAAVTRRLASSLDDADLNERLGEVAALAVPRFADCCVVTRLGASAHELVAVKHAVPEQERLVRALYLGAATDALDPGAGLKSAEPILSPSSESALGETDDDSRHATMIRDLHACSVMTARLSSHDEPAGAISFLHTDHSGRQHTAEERRMMQELARSATVAFENARLYREVRRAVILREEFVAIASHELRTPVTTLMLQLELLKTLIAGAPDPLRERLVAKHARLDKQTGRIDRLVNDLLDVAQSRAEYLALKLQRVDLARLAHQVSGRLAEMASSAGCPVALDAPLPIVGHWDLRRLEQLITNLLSNALKYGKGKAIEIKCWGDESGAVLSIRDHGIGISPIDAQRIFERFERAVSARHFSGLGLGLHIAQNIAVAHGGSIVVKSQLGQGATFLVHLPLEVPASADREKALNAPL